MSPSFATPELIAKVSRDATPGRVGWDRSVAAFLAGQRAMQDLVAAPAKDLFTPLPHGEAQTAVLEALLVADRNAFHVGPLVVVRRLLGS